MGLPTRAQQTHDKIQKLINSSRFNESFLLLKNKYQQFENLKKEFQKLISIESTYKYMLDYMANGNVDNSREDMIEQIRENLHVANDLLYRETKIIDSGDLYSSTKRMFALRNTDFKQLLEEYKNELQASITEHGEEAFSQITPPISTILNEIFNYVWTINYYQNEDMELISGCFEDKSLPEYFKIILVSAIILGNLSYFNPDSFELLINISDSTDSLGVKARALTGIVLIGLLNPDRIKGNIKLRSRLLINSEDENLNRIINDILINIVRTYDTKRIDTKMRNEVIPGLMKIQPEIIDKLKNLASESEDFLSDGNPDWEEFIENSDIGDKLKEINDLQLEGADVMVTAFSNLKGFPFFNQIVNWFLPFVPNHYEFTNLQLDSDTLATERLSIIMCESDLHSFLLSLNSMPAERKNQMLSNLKLQMKEMYESLAIPMEASEEQKLNIKSRHFLQDLYRFFKFYRKKEGFNDPFNIPIVRSNIEPLISILRIEQNNIKVLADFYLKNKYYAEAAGLFELIDFLQPGDFNIWEKIGYSYHRLQRFDEAVKWYSKAELGGGNNLWLNKKLALALKNVGKHDEAVIYYTKALENEPENYHLLMSAGQCYLSSGDPEKALPLFFHAHYINPAKIDALRAVAWAELLSGEFEKSKSRYEKILSDKSVERIDYLNAGHGALASGDLKNALILYRKYVEQSESKDVTDLVIAFRDDNEALKQLKIKTPDLRLIVDKLRYDLGN